MRTIAILGVWLMVPATQVLAQNGAKCALDLRSAPTAETQIGQTATGRTIEIAGGLEAFCGSGQVRADSGTYYEETGLLLLRGNVRYRDERRTLVSERATYYADGEWVKAEGAVVLTDLENGSTLAGQTLDYYPVTESRAVESLFAPDRPHLKLSSEQGAVPFEVDADRVHLYGDSVMAAAGNVETTRNELRVHGDSLFLAAGQELWVLGEPRIEQDDLAMRGDTIRAWLAGDAIEEMRAWPNGSAVGADLSLEGPELRLFVEDEQVTRALAWRGEDASELPPSGSGEPVARGTTLDYVLTADSIDVQRPGGVLDQVAGVGRAQAEAREASVPGDPLGTDWIEGDTIFAYFEAAPDSSAGETEGSDGTAPGGTETRAMRRLVAHGDARALYHVFDEGDPEADPGVNYVKGRVITIWFVEREVEEVVVHGGAGVYLEPVRGLPTPADTLVVPADSSRASGEQPTGEQPSGEQATGEQPNIEGAGT